MRINIEGESSRERLSYDFNEPRRQYLGSNNKIDTGFACPQPRYVNSLYTSPSSFSSVSLAAYRHLLSPLVQVLLFQPLIVLDVVQLAYNSAYANQNRRYAALYSLRIDLRDPIDAPCPERSPRNFSMPHIYSKRIFQAKKIFHCVCTNVRSCDSIDQFLSIRYYPIILIREIVKNRVKKRIKKKKWKKFNPTLHDYTLTLRNQSLDTTFVVL